MNKSVTRIVCLALSAMTILPLASCKKKKKYVNDPETRPVVFATEALDGNFNPFFATSAGDSEMASMTQLGMLVTDESGNITYGKDEPTVTLDYRLTEVQEGGNTYTDYEFIIKNDIKFSDGTDLTIKDVLFNLYVYLDPAYMGSATMYSTDIVGLQRYRAQDPTIQDGQAANDINSSFESKALARRQTMIDHLSHNNSNPCKHSAAEIQQVNNDIVKLKELFMDEVKSDWTNNQGTQEAYEDEYTITEDWQIFYLVEGIIKVTTDATTRKPLKDTNGKYITNITVPNGVALEDGTVYDNERVLTTTNGYVDYIQADIEEAMYGLTGDAAYEAAKNHAIQTVYDTYAGEDAIDSQILKILIGWASGSNLLDWFTGEIRTDYYEQVQAQNNGLPVPTISGITTYKTKKDFADKKLKGGEYDVLKIRINGIDPKAVYNFSFAVAPMHYYSGTFEGVDYVAQADGVNSFGVAFNNSRFFEQVLQADAKNKKPVGAGPYQASNSSGAATGVDGNDFYSNNWVYFVRNDHFETVGDDIENAKIKYLRYKVVNTDKLLQALESKDIDVGEPNATADNITKIGTISHLNQKTVATNGYGYVGINPKYVPDIEVRRVIMKAMDPSHCINYYTDANAEVIYRSMSYQSWIWNYIQKPTSTGLGNLLSEQAVKDELANYGWTYNATTKKLQKQGDDGTMQTLKYTFTIAGATTDHPAYTMFSKAAELLNKAGFDITVTTDVQALKKLATGQLAVWAAAWSSTVDPDMYQVYHKDSTATSVNNWGYPTILNDATGQFTEEKGIIENLSQKIDEGRETNDQQRRAKIYEEALELVMKLAVELPTYQRKDCVAYNAEVIDSSSLNKNPTAFAGVIDRIWELDYN